MSVRKIGVVGAGTLGQGIVQTAASHGIDVIFKEINEEKVREAIEDIEQALDREIERWAITASEKKACLSRITGTHSEEDLVGCDLIAEAVQEEIEQKRAVMKSLDALMPEGRIFIVTASTLSVSEIASVTDRPESVIGLHFLTPVPRRPLVEVIRAFHTSDATFAEARDFVEALGKTAIEVFEYPGLVTTRVMLPLINEAMHVVMEGVASAEDVDKAMRLGFEMPIGPLQMADRMGLDQVMLWTEHLLHELGETKYRPCPLLRKMVRAGHLGVKTGRGVFRYSEEGDLIES